MLWAKMRLRRLDRPSDLLNCAKKLVDGVLNRAGHSSAELRRAVFDRSAALDNRATQSAIPEALTPYVDKIGQHAYKIVDRDIEALRNAGYDDDQIFELTICAAAGAGFARLERGLKAVAET
jgi:hypothetical protein